MLKDFDFINIQEIFPTHLKLKEESLPHLFPPFPLPGMVYCETLLIEMYGTIFLTTLKQN
jgi:hypothetical protein